MSYTESDVIENIYEAIKDHYGVNYYIVRTLIGWYEKQRSNYKVNGWDTKDFDDKIKLLKSKTNE